MWPFLFAATRFCTHNARMEEHDITTLISQAIAALDKGFPSSAVLEELLKHVPEAQKDEVRKRFNREVVAYSTNTAQQKQATAQDEKKNTSFTAVISLITHNVREKIQKLLTRPDIDRAVREAGKVFARYGMTVDRTHVQEQDLGALAPMIGLAKNQQKEKGQER